MIICPLGNNILIERSEPEVVTKGGILIPDASKEKLNRGTAIRVGKGKKLDDGTYSELEVQQGDTVLFSDYAGNEVKYNEETFIIISESDILAIIKEESEE